MSQSVSSHQEEKLQAQNEKIDSLTNLLNLTQTNYNSLKQKHDKLFEDNNKLKIK